MNLAQAARGIGPVDRACALGISRGRLADMGLRDDTEKRIDDWSQYSFPALARHIATGVDGGEDLQHPASNELVASLGQIVRALRATALDLAEEIERLQTANRQRDSGEAPHQ